MKIFKLYQQVCIKFIFNQIRMTIGGSSIFYAHHKFEKKTFNLVKIPSCL